MRMPSEQVGSIALFDINTYFHQMNNPEVELRGIA
jgi:hypothetical protein